MFLISTERTSEFRTVDLHIAESSVIQNLQFRLIRFGNVGKILLVICV